MDVDETIAKFTEFGSEVKSTNSAIDPVMFNACRSGSAIPFVAVGGDPYCRALDVCSGRRKFIREEH